MEYRKDVELGRCLILEFLVDEQAIHLTGDEVMRLFVQRTIAETIT